ncbi:Protein TBC-1 [Aphelenchoides avenae]|nr:Protein TBC-1 [Aphelenchus avenae]
MMVISRFLQQNREHISYVDGGYKALHSLLADVHALSKLSNHFAPNDCVECSVKKTSSSSGWSIMERMKSAVKSKSEAVKLKVHELVDSPVREEPIKHVSSTDRAGKRYRNVQSVFSIHDDEDTQDSQDDLSVRDADELLVSEKLKWSEVIKKPEITDNFEGHEVFQDKSHVPCYIALSRTHMHIFHDAKESGFVKTAFRHQLSSIMRVTSKRRIPEFLTFKFGYELPTGEAHITKVHCFVLPKAGDCAKAVKTAIVQLKPTLMDDDD